MTEIVTLIATLAAEPAGGLGAALLQSAASVGAVHVFYGSLNDKNTDMSAMILYAKRNSSRPFPPSTAIDFFVKGL
jgi:hypothetical protein